MIIENKGEFDVSELLEHKANIKIIEFKNISELVRVRSEGIPSRGAG